MSCGFQYRTNTEKSRSPKGIARRIFPRYLKRRIASLSNVVISAVCAGHSEQRGRSGTSVAQGFSLSGCSQCNPAFPADGRIRGQDIRGTVRAEQGGHDLAEIRGIRERFPELTAEVFSEKRMFRGRDKDAASEAFCRENSLFQPAEDSDQYLPEICHFCLEFSSGSVYDSI